jgi:hypothetical protein
MNARIKRARKECPVYILKGQQDGPAIIRIPRLTKKKESTVVIANGMVVPP